MQPVNKSKQYLVIGVVCTLLGAILFSGKAVLVKIIYKEYSIDVVSLLSLRMLFSLPFYIAMYFSTLKTYRKQHGATAFANSNRKLIVHAVFIGIVGYYVSSYLDFAGLQFISAGLERIILFIYPTFTILFAALLYKTSIKRYQIIALAICYLGVLIAFIADFQTGHSANIVKGSVLIFFCAITYAWYVLQSGRLVSAMGAGFFTAVAMLGATAGVLTHYFISGNGWLVLQQLPLRIYGYIVVMAVFTTVLPSLMLSIGLKRIGSSNAAILSSVGPISTIIQAYWFLGEKFGLLQALGTVFVVAGVLVIGRNASKEKG